MKYPGSKHLISSVNVRIACLPARAVVCPRESAEHEGVAVVGDFGARLKPR